MNDGQKAFLAAVSLLLLAIALRFYDLGKWPYAGDEFATVFEERVLFHGQVVPHESPMYRLPHAIPLGYLPIHVSHTLFGESERGTRVVVALLGSLTVVLVFLLLNGALSRTTAVVTALLLALMPMHILFSQMTRFYITASMFSFLALSAGARIPGPHGTRYAVLGCCFALLAALSHSVLLLVLPLVVVATYGAFRAEGRPVPRVIWLVFGVAAAATVPLILYLRSLLQDWNQGETWGYSVPHASLALIGQLGWATACLTAVGTLLMLRERTAQNWYWLICLGAWVIVSMLLPMVIIYHPAYAFSFALSAVIVAAYAITYISDLLKPHNWLAAYAWIGLSCLGDLPSLFSHYVDGTRTNMRDAAAYVRAHWQPGDRVTGYAMGAFDYYSGRCCKPAIPLPETKEVPNLTRLASGGGRLWVVLEEKRPGLDTALQAWLFACSVQKLSVGRRRLDWLQFKEDVYLVPAQVIDNECPVRRDSPG